MFGHASQTIIEGMVKDSMLRIIKDKTGIKSDTQGRYLEFVSTFKKVQGVVKISSIYLKNKKHESFSRISPEEIRFSGASSNEFIMYLRNLGAKQVKNKQNFLEQI